MKLQDINPFVRYAEKTKFYPFTMCVYAEDSRIFYIKSGRARIEIEGETFDLSPTDAVLICPNVEYKFSDVENLIAGVLNFDFDMKRADVKLPYRLSRERLHGDVGVTVDEFPEFKGYVVLSNYTDIEKDIFKIIEEFDTRRIYFRERASGYLKLLICEFLMNMSGVGSAHGEKADAILEYIAEHLGEVSCGRDVAAVFSYHPYYLSRLIKLHTGKTLKQYVLTLRVNEARKLLKTTELPLSEISERLGFENSAYFSNCFKKRTGVSPSEFRKRNNDYII